MSPAWEPEEPQGEATPRSLSRRMGVSECQAVEHSRGAISKPGSGSRRGRGTGSQARICGRTRGGQASGIFCSAVSQSPTGLPVSTPSDVSEWLVVPCGAGAV